jgi:hypothetical protein
MFLVTIKLQILQFVLVNVTVVYEKNACMPFYQGPWSEITSYGQCVIVYFFNAYRKTNCVCNKYFLLQILHKVCSNIFRGHC